MDDSHSSQSNTYNHHNGLFVAVLQRDYKI